MALSLIKRWFGYKEDRPNPVLRTLNLQVLNDNDSIPVTHCMADIDGDILGWKFSVEFINRELTMSKRDDFIEAITLWLNTHPNACGIRELLINIDNIVVLYTLNTNITSSNRISLLMAYEQPASQGRWFGS